MIGVLVGAVGVGGFLLVPVLVLVQRVAVQDAVMLATVSFLAAGVVSVCAMRQAHAEGGHGRAAFLLGSAAGAAGGALLVGVLNDRVLGGFIACAFAAAAIAEWIGWPRAREHDGLHIGSGSIAGGATGLASTLTGTSGPVAAIPILGLLGVEVRRRVRLAQVAQIPIGLAALLTYATSADVPWELGVQSAVAIAAGSVVGIIVAPRIPLIALRRVTSILMLLAAAYMASAAL